jgi:HNH endonuclease/Homing endonuclease associated repeat
MEYTLERHRTDKLPRTTLVAELLRVAELCQFVEFGKREFDAFAVVSAQSVIREFGAWSSAIAHLRNQLAEKGKSLQKKRRGYFDEAECLAELERIWRLLGHRPSRTEWEHSKPSISYNTYVRYFGGWVGASLRFLESRTEGSMSASRLRVVPLRLRVASRDVQPGLRIRVYERDRFRCVYCGRSRLTNPDVELHVDHVHPFSQGGKTEIQNLQTLCSTCNLGKGARTDVQAPNA